MWVLQRADGCIGAYYKLAQPSRSHALTASILDNAVDDNPAKITKHPNTTRIKGNEIFTGFKLDLLALINVVSY